MKKAAVQLLSILLFFGVCSLSSCRENNKVNSPEMDSGQDGVAIITLEDGREIEFGATFSTVQSTMGKMIGLSNSHSGMFLLLSVRIPYNESLEEREYDGQLTMKQQRKDDIIHEEYRSFYYENPATGEKGKAKITFTKITGNHLSGNFSGTLYSESGKKAVISDGKFSLETD